MKRSAQLRTYNRRDSAVFLKTTEKWGGLSNMAGGFSLWVNRVPIPTSEHLYQACRFPHMPDVQRVIIEQASPMTAKMKSKPFRSQSRPDWDHVRVRIMRWCLRVKLAQNWQKFASVLIETGERSIVEESRKDDFWGAKPQDDGTLVGCNVLGRLLMELREELKRPTAEALRRVEPIPLHDFNLYGKPILAVEPRNIVITQPDPDLVPTPDSLWSQPPESIEASAELAADEAPSEPLIVEVKSDAETPEPQKQEAARSMTPYPKRLIEVDLPIARISAHARREKSVGTISSLHIWWARRPLAACRAIILASLWPDPVDLSEWAKEADAKGEVRAPKGEALKPGEGVVIRPKRFLNEARQRMIKWSQIALGKASNESYKLLVQISKNPKLLDDPATLRTALLDFIADLADWDHSTDKDYLDTSRALVQAAHEALGGETGTRPMVIDPFAGGGSIPLEALRVGADAFASDLNPIPVLLNKVVLEYIPKYGQRLADEVRKWGHWVKEQAENELAELYPKDQDGSTPIAYLWARTVLSEAPGEGTIPVEVPLMRSLWLSKKTGRKRALRWARDDKGRVKTQTVEVLHQVDGRSRAMKVKRPVLEVFEPLKDTEVEGGTVARGNATCPVTGFTTKVSAVRAQLKQRRGGSSDARLLAVVLTRKTEQGRFFRVPTKGDEHVARSADLSLSALRSEVVDVTSTIAAIPNEPTPLGGGSGAGRAFGQRLYGMDVFSDLFTSRQLVALATLARYVRLVEQEVAKRGDSAEGDNFGQAVQACLACAISRQADHGCSGCTWNPSGPKLQHLFTRQAISLAWDFAEANPFGGSVGDWMSAVDCVGVAIDAASDSGGTGHVEQADATRHPLPDDSAAAFVTDPPYYDAVPYSDLSDFCYVWLKRSLPGSFQKAFAAIVTPKAEECIVDDAKDKDKAFFERTMMRAMSEGRRVTMPHGIGVVVFAHKSTAGWEAQLTGMIDAGWIVTGSWPIDTELETRLRGMNSAALASSVHLIVRPRERSSGESLKGVIGEWREILAELPKKLDEWMPRLANEGVVGADAIFACLGPALEIFSRYSRVEKASGEAVTLREYLEHVWAAVSSEALSMIFKDADAAGLEPDARLTAMWLWTLGGGKPQSSGEGEDGEEAENDEEEETTSKKGVKVAGFVLEFDAARKIAQGLGIHLEKSESIVEVKGESARLLPVSERTRHLFGKDAEEDTAKTRNAKKKAKQGSLFEELDAIEAEAASTGGRFGGLEGAKPGATVLDKVHQSMILFAAGRGEALKRFLVEDGVGKDGRFWKLAQSLSALYPTGTDEKRWVDGVLARKKGLGF